MEMTAWLWVVCVRGHP